MCTINEHHLIFGCWNIRCDREIFNILGHSLRFSLLTTWKIKIITLKKTLRDIIILHICTIFTCMVPEIWSATDIIFCHSRPFFALLPPNNPKNQNFEKMKKLPGDIITFQTCDINGNHMMYGSWNIEHDGQNFLSIWTVLCTFTPLTTWKIKILKKFKKCQVILSFYTCVSYMTIIWCMVPDVSSVTDRICCHFGPFFAPLPL